MYIARQPIVDSNRRIVAYELLFRSPERPVSDGVYATAMVTSTVLADARFEDVLGGHRAFINVDSKFLMSEMVELLPPERAVLELLEDTVFTPDVVARCAGLRSLGYTLASDDYAGDASMLAPVIDHLDIIKVDLRQVAPEALSAIADSLREKKLLAEKVETIEEFERCLAAGYHLFQGYFIAKPLPVGAVGPDPARMAALKLLSMAMRNADTATLEAEVKRHPALAVGLLRLANSAASGLAQPISMMRQAFLAVGRKPLERWLQILVYLGGSGSDPGTDPLLQMAAVRARLMESIARQIGRTGERAFLTGLVSLFDAALGISREEVVRRLSLDTEIEAAILLRNGDLGALLALVEAMEAGLDDDVQRALGRLPPISEHQLLEASTAAMRWASDLGQR